MYLIDLKKGSKKVIKEITGNVNARKKLLHLGLVPGVEVKVIENNNKGPIVIEVFNSKIMLGRGMASKIMVT